MSISADAPTSGTASIAFVDCEISGGAGPSSGEGVYAHAHRRWEVVIAGKRIKTVDVHAHCIVPDAAKLINHPLEAPALLWSNVGDRLTHMDKSGVDVEALSINPFWYRAERDAAEQLIKVQNETLVEFCAGHPDRFVGIRDGGAAVSGPRCAASRARGQETRVSRRRRCRQRCQPGIGEPKIPPVLGEVRGIGRAGFHAPTWHPRIGAERSARRQRPVDQYDRQSARDHDRAVAPDLRGNARPFSGAQDMRRAWRRLPAVLRQPLGRGD